MSRLNVAPIVEGHGEQQSAIRTLITRVWTEIAGGEYVHVLRPIRRPRAHLVNPTELLRDQPRLTAAMDLFLCRSRSRSFDKFCRELERRVRS